MNSLDKQARAELVQNLRGIYLKGDGLSGGGSKAGSKKNPYIQYLKEYKGVKPNLTYKQHKKKYSLKGGAGTKEGAKKNNYIQYQKKYKGVKNKPPYDKNVNYSVPSPPLPKRPTKKAVKALKKEVKKGNGRKGKPLNPKLKMFNKCVKEYRMKNPNVSFRQAQQYVKNNIDYSNNECEGEFLGIREVGMGGVLDDYGGVLDDYGGVLDDYGGVLDDYGGMME